jgi:hypothetical protein
MWVPEGQTWWMVLKRGSDFLDFFGQRKGTESTMQRGINLVILTADDEEITENAELTSERSLIALTCKQRALPSAYVYSLDPYFTVGYVSSRNQRSLEGRHILSFSF